LSAFFVIFVSMNMEYDKLNGDVAFREFDHKYFNVKYLNRKYISVTTLIQRYYEPFDGEFWSRYKALEALMGPDFVTTGVKMDLLNKKEWNDAYLDTFDIDYKVFYKKQQEISTGYDQVRNVACERGTLYHGKQESRFYEKQKHRMEEYNFNLEHLAGEFSCVKHNFDLNDEKTVLPEYLLYYSTSDGILNLAGQADVIVKDGNDIYVLDFKTNAKGIKSKAHFDKNKKKKQTMWYPDNNLDDHDMNHYTLQLSLYAWMLQKINPEFNIKLLRIIHIDGNDKQTLYDLPYLKDEVERMLKHYKKTLKIEHYRETGELI
jgi:hypothetical protein